MFSGKILDQAQAIDAHCLWTRVCTAWLVCWRNLINGSFAMYRMVAIELCLLCDRILIFFFCIHLLWLVAFVNQIGATLSLFLNL